MKKFKVLIADAQNEVRRQLVKALKDDQSIEIVGEKMCIRDRAYAS